LFVAALLALLGCFTAVWKSIDTFNHPGSDIATYPTDYWSSFSGAQTSDKRTLFQEAVNGWEARKPEAMKQVQVSDGAASRPICYFWDAGPLGVTGPLLTGLGFALPGPLLVLAWLLLLGTARRIVKGHTLVRSLLACGLMLLPFPGLHMLSVQSIWDKTSSSGVPDATTLSCVLLGGYTVLFVIAWRYLRNASFVPRITGFILWFVSVVGPLVRLVNPAWLPTLTPFALFLTAAMIYMTAAAFVFVVFNPPPLPSSDKAMPNKA
jgi:hypothetical protein